MARHERRAGEIAAEVFHDMPISLSHRILPEMQEYERALTTIVNAAVRPVVSHYVGNLSRQLASKGFRGRFNLLRSDGGLISAAKAQAAPVNLLMSGPAGGVAGALWIARNAGYENVLTLDVGGTSTDVALIQRGSVSTAHPRYLGWSFNGPRIIARREDRWRGRRVDSTCAIADAGVAGWARIGGRSARPGLLPKRRHQTDCDRCQCCSWLSAD